MDIVNTNMKSYSYCVLLVTLFFCKVIFASNNYEYSKAANYEDSGDSLFLTKLIEDGKVLQAKQRARVYHAELQNIESYAGYFTVDKKYNSNLFFWYFPSQSKPKSDPVVLWLQGGPGSTSLLGLFTGNGPIFVNVNNTLEFRKYSWNLNHNVIYIDSPVGAGFSFTEDELGYARNESVIARQLYEALNQFFDLFPELRSNEFFATGESYAGKYIPALCNEIKNRNAVETKKINLVGLAIGNGWVDPINQVDYSDYLYQIGLIDDKGKKIFKNAFNRVRYNLKNNKPVVATKLLNCIMLTGCEYSNVTEFQKTTGFTNYYNYKYQTKPDEYSRYIPWVQQPSVRKAIHVGNQNFTGNSRKVFNYMTNSFAKSMAPVLADMLQHYRVLIYTGQLDIVCAYPMVENYLRQLKWSGAEEYQTAPRKQWWIDDDLAGYTKTVQNLTNVMIRNAGHMAPTDQPLWVWKMISRFIRQEDL